MEKILITVDKERNYVLEYYAKKIGGGATKSGVIRDALDLFFKMKLGFSYNRLKNEIKKRDS